MNALPRIIYCRCDYPQLAPEQTRQAVLDLLEASPVDWLEVADLCGLAARRDRRLPEIITPDTILLACFPRTIRWLLGRAGVGMPDALRVINLRSESPEDAVQLLQAEMARSAPAAGSGEPQRHQHDRHLRWERADDWTAWFPVLDYDRCRQCKQCMNFCLFGVFALDAQGRVEVARPENCKTNCPACARICPEVAIIFPKEAHAPINGSPVTAADEQRKDLAVEVDRIKQTDIYAALRQRGIAAASGRFAVPDETTDTPSDRVDSGPCSCGSCPTKPSGGCSTERSVSGSATPAATTPETAADSSSRCGGGPCDCQCDCDEGDDASCCSDRGAS
ncbi:MAG: ferredoxin family protein [Sedimentisphaerales bacterium]|nr:ferredoxin family protein [Sedimentisphaerales bacterium]